MAIILTFPLHNQQLRFILCQRIEVKMDRCLWAGRESKMRDEGFPPYIVRHSIILTIASNTNIHIFACLSLMVIIGSRMTVAAYATSTTLRIATAFSPSLLFSSQVLRPSSCWSQASLNAAPFRPTFPSKLSMAAASTSADLADSELDIASNILSVTQRISDAISSNDRPEGSVRLVAVSKTKPLEFLQVAYQVRNRNVYLVYKIH